MVPTLAAMVVAAGSSAGVAFAPLTLERRQELLFDAARLGRTEMIHLLVLAGADVDGRDPRGFTPLILAAYNGHLETTDALIAAKADPCLPDREQGNTALMGVAFKGFDVIAARLIEAGCKVNARNHAGQTALMMAALFNRTDQIDMLIAAGADPSLRDAAGRSATSVAQAQGNDAVVRMLAAYE